jgi:virulence factor Mce-like protein
MRRRPSSSVVANPVLVGAVTTLVVVVAVFLAYNANNGLPFVPTTTIKVQLTSGANLVKGNEVRTGGFRVGVVTDVQPVMLPTGRAGAELTLKLDKAAGRVPRDSRVVVRPRSALGLKYVELTTGRSRETLADGETIPVRQTKLAVELDELYGMFDAETRDASRRNLDGFGAALAGRGADLSRTIEGAPGFLRGVESVMANLADPRTKLEAFFAELGDFTRTLAPVSEQNARLFTSLADTFEGFSADPRALQDTIELSPPALDSGTRSLRVQRPFLERTASLSRDLRLAAVELDDALPPLSEALRVGAPVQRRSVELNEPLRQVLASAGRLVRAPTTIGSLYGLEATMGTAVPTLRSVGPFITVCNAFTNFWTAAAEHLTAPDSTGQAQRALLNSSQGYAPGTDHIGNSGANEFAHGVTREDGTGPQRLHANFHPSAVKTDGTADCAAGNQGFVRSANPFRDRSLPGDPYRDLSVDDFFPPNGFGPVYDQQTGDGSAGTGVLAPRVPEGQTFERFLSGLGKLGGKEDPPNP